METVRMLSCDISWPPDVRRMELGRFFFGGIALGTADAGRAARKVVVECPADRLMSLAEHGRLQWREARDAEQFELAEFWDAVCRQAAKEAKACGKEKVETVRMFDDDVPWPPKVEMYQEKLTIHCRRIVRPLDRDPKLAAKSVVRNCPGELIGELWAHAAERFETLSKTTLSTAPILEFWANVVARTGSRKIMEKDIVAHCDEPREAMAEIYDPIPPCLRIELPGETEHLEANRALVEAETPQPWWERKGANDLVGRILRKDRNTFECCVYSGKTPVTRGRSRWRGMKADATTMLLADDSPWRQVEWATAPNETPDPAPVEWPVIAYASLPGMVSMRMEENAGSIEIGNIPAVNYIVDNMMGEPRAVEHAQYMAEHSTGDVRECWWRVAMALRGFEA